MTTSPDRVAASAHPATGSADRAAPSREGVVRSRDPWRHLQILSRHRLIPGRAPQVERLHPARASSGPRIHDGISKSRRAIGSSRDSIRGRSGAVMECWRPLAGPCPVRSRDPWRPLQIPSRHRLVPGRVPQIEQLRPASTSPGLMPLKIYGLWVGQPRAEACLIWCAACRRCRGGEAAVTTHSFSLNTAGLTFSPWPGLRGGLSSDGDQEPSRGASVPRCRATGVFLPPGPICSMNGLRIGREKPLLPRPMPAHPPNAPLTSLAPFSPGIKSLRAPPQRFSPSSDEGPPKWVRIEDAEALGESKSKAMSQALRVVEVRATSLLGAPEFGPAVVP
jgi:hypothetical protein